MLTSILIAAAITLAEPGSDYEGVELPPKYSDVLVGDWTYIGEDVDGESLVLAQPFRLRGRVWVRFEYAKSTAGVRSSRSLVELDCSQWRFRWLQSAHFAGQNLTSSLRSNAQTSEWSYAAPNTMAEAFLNYGCGD
ncbi:surface-adhesin E family protein [Brevundimonas pondensis]|uniref:surface-adhesin E family protein n=1 Tax=Brevundimonas pondensis TaxID=2774189 RepID=UPI00384F7106